MRTLVMLTSALIVIHAVAWGQDTPDAANGKDMVDGWIIGADNKVMRMDEDGTTSVIHLAPGLQHFTVIPGTQLAVAGSEAGVELFKDGKWEWLARGQWEQIDYSMNYRAMNVLFNIRGRRHISVIQLVPEVEAIEALPLPDPPRDLGGRYTLGYGERSAYHTEASENVRRRRIQENARVALPSTRGELAFRSCYYKYDVDSPPVEVSVTHGAAKSPVEFIASGEEKGVAYAVVMGDAPRQFLLRLDMGACTERSTACPSPTSSSPQPASCWAMRAT